MVESFHVPIQEDMRFSYDVEGAVEDYLGEVNSDPSYGIIQNPNLQSELEGVPGKAELRDTEGPNMNHYFEDTWDYLTERVDEEHMQQIGVLNPHSNGRFPRCWVIGYLDGDRKAETESGYQEYLNMIELFYDDSWDETGMFANSIHPEQLDFEERKI